MLGWYVARCIIHRCRSMYVLVVLPPGGAQRSLSTASNAFIHPLSSSPIAQHLISQGPKPPAFLSVGANARSAKKAHCKSHMLPLLGKMRGFPGGENPVYYKERTLRGAGPQDTAGEAKDLVATEDEVAGGPQVRFVQIKTCRRIWSPRTVVGPQCQRIAIF